MISQQSIRGRYAARLLENRLITHYRSSLSERDRGGPIELPDWSLPSRDMNRRERVPRGKVGIIGAGVAGLYLGMLCDYHDIDYDILEASDRAGGRVYTHQFSKDHTNIRHNYYDVGAMRFPDLGFMKPVFQLMDYLEVKRAPYYPSNSSTPNLFYGHSITNQNINELLEPFDRVVQSFIKGLTENFEAGFQALLYADKFSTRDYLMNIAQPNMSPAEVQTLETYDTGTGSYDRAFSGTVLDYFDLNVATNWFRVEDGTGQLTQAMLKSLRNAPSLRKRVNKIWYDKPKETVHVQVDDERSPRSYYTVFNTTTMSCLGQMDTSGLGLSDEQQTAIRALSYDRSCKVAIKFSKAWWVELGVEPGKGGSSATDLPIRTMVYPSWIDGDDPNKPAVAIVSYTWDLNATKIGALIRSPSDATQNAQLLDLVLNNLSRVYDNKITPTQIKELVLDHHAYAWHQDPNMAGAYALFGPGQFTNLYPTVQMPAADGRFYIAGECISAYHAWVVGALDSVYMQFLSFLIRFKLLNKALDLKDSRFGDGEGLHVDEVLEKHAYWKAKLSPGVDIDF